MNCNEEFLKTGPYSISYKREHIGVTLDSPRLSFEPEFYEARCNQSGYKTVRKIVTNMKITISVNLKQVSGNFARFHDARGKTVNVAFDEGVLETGGILSLAPLSEDSGIAYCFPRSVLVPESAYAYKGPESYYLKIKFEVYENSDGVLLEKHSR